jgi:hypothetical protein
MVPRLLGAGLMGLGAVCFAQQPERPGEIEALLEMLPASGCEFRRNDVWRGGVEARDHLRMKYKYMRERNPRLSAEDFISEAATRSSTSGQVYLVRCQGGPDLLAGAWLSGHLKSIRARGDPRFPRDR